MVEFNLIAIAKGWVEINTQDADVRGEAEKRLRVCGECPNRRQLNVAMQWVVRIAGKEETDMHYCAICTCPLAAKTVSRDSLCPLGLWPDWGKSN